MTDWITSTQSAIARVVADAVGGYIFTVGLPISGAAGQTAPMADDFTEAGLPAVTVILGTAALAHQPGNLRARPVFTAMVFRPRVPLADSIAALNADLVAIDDAFSAHTKAYLAESTLQSALVTEFHGPRGMTLPVGQSERVFLVASASIEVVLNRPVTLQPA